MVKKGTKNGLGKGKKKRKGKERRSGLVWSGMALAPMDAGEFDGSSFYYEGGGGRDGKCVRVLRNGGGRGSMFRFALAW